MKQFCEKNDIQSSNSTLQGWLTTRKVFNGYDWLYPSIPQVHLRSFPACMEDSLGSGANDVDIVLLPYLPGIIMPLSCRAGLNVARTRT